MADATYGASKPTETEVVDDERTTLIQKRRPRKLRRSIAAAAALVLCGTAIKVRRGAITELGELGELGEYPTTTWESVNNDQVETVYDLEEHVLVVTQVNEAYVLFKELLFGRLGRATGTLDPSRGVRVKSHSYGTSAWNLFQVKLDAKLIKANSIVWFSVANTMDALVAGGKKDELNAMGVTDEMIYWGCNSGDVCDGSDGELLVQRCVYAYGDDILLHNTLLRTLLAYELPLTIVLNSDLNCKMRLPVTHHKIIYAGDSCQELVEEYRSRGGDAAWFPQGYEGAVTDDAVDALVENVEASLKADKDTLLSYAGSVIFRKPSRVRLGEWAINGGIEEMEQLAARSGLKLDVESYGMYGMDKIHPEGPEVTWTAGISDEDSDTLQGRSYYVLAPAGDVWSSGREIEAHTFGAIPVVDQTYKTDGGVSAKGCVDPASAWRNIAADTFVFVDDWSKLPETLIQNDALDVEKRAARVSRLHGILRRVADDARAAILAPPKNAKTVCETVPLFDSQLQQLVQQAYDYYTQPAPEGAPYGGMPWFDAFVENPALPTNTCGAKDLSASGGAKCFDEACALPSAGSFDCKFV